MAGMYEVLDNVSSCATMTSGKLSKEPEQAVYVAIRQLKVSV